MTKYQEKNPKIRSFIRTQQIYLIAIPMTFSFQINWQPNIHQTRTQFTILHFRNETQQYLLDININIPQIQWIQLISEIINLSRERNFIPLSSSGTKINQMNLYLEPIVLLNDLSPTKKKKKNPHISQQITGDKRHITHTSYKKNTFFLLEEQGHSLLQPRNVFFFFLTQKNSPEQKFRTPPNLSAWPCSDSNNRNSSLPWAIRTVSK